MKHTDNTFTACNLRLIKVTVILPLEPDAIAFAVKVESNTTFTMGFSFITLVSSSSACPATGSQARYFFLWFRGDLLGRR